MKMRDHIALRLILLLWPVCAGADPDCVAKPMAALPDDALPDERAAALRATLKRRLQNFHDCLPAETMMVDAGAESVEDAAHEADAKRLDEADTAHRSDDDAGRESKQAAGGYRVDHDQAPAQQGDATRRPGGDNRDGGNPIASEDSRRRESNDDGACLEGRCPTPFVEDDVARELRERAERTTDPAVRRELMVVYEDYMRSRR